MISTTRTRRPRLETVRRRLERWRRRRRHPRAPLPPDLWAAAVALVPAHGLSGTARALRLGYGALKQHVEAASGRPRRRQAAFLELAVPPAPRRDAWAIEIEGAGTIVRLRLNDLALTDLAEFTRRVVGAAA
jgi:hypothetical protein